ncbi:AgmX/PglI C-terminal domain-containing protein [Myxococcus sp. K38C18041901]|uniref:AgmX/PglI C-terminal domain-containing protein n=1 Tax=Myxococcus guangdongensis TaxID=2906760 RepID=UPI0020A75119|nr:AgmX/PglI C-terminal domain-containing protein [Myxococcus guangdongensis]MCP3062287.1 AgmX/PglI C-terminal domain-containing protein [Myxococcus guangdongensis]
MLRTTAPLLLLSTLACHHTPDRAQLPRGQDRLTRLLEGPLGVDSIRRVIQSHREEILQCYSWVWGTRPLRDGKITIRFVIGAEGHVSEAKVQQTLVHEPELEDCMVGQIRTWRFPKPSKELGKVVVSYPFIFKQPS